MAAGVVMRARFTWLPLGLAVCLAGCSSDTFGLVIRGVIPPSTDCSYDVETTRLQLDGVLDVSSRSDYFLVARVENLRPRDHLAHGPDAVFLERAEVELLDVDFAPLAPFGGGRQGALPNPATVPAAGTIPASDGVDAGADLSFFSPLASVYGEMIRDALVPEPGDAVDLLLRLQLRGRHVGGQVEQTPDFFYPLTVCNGCLRIEQDDDPATEPVCGESCNPGLDVPFSDAPECR